MGLAVSGSKVEAQTEVEYVGESEGVGDAQSKAEDSVAGCVAVPECRVEEPQTDTTKCERDEMRVVFESAIETQAASTRGNNYNTITSSHSFSFSLI